MKNNYFDIKKWRWMVPSIQKLPKDYSSSPVTLRIDLTTNCNFDCSYCLYQSKASVIKKNKKYQYPNKLKLNHRKLIQIIKLFAARGLKSVIITGGGEPTLYHGFSEILEVLFHNKIQVGLITNGSKIDGQFIKKHLNNNYLRWIRISLDSANPETWQAMHRPVDGSSFSTVINNVKQLVKITDRKFLVALNFLITPINYKEIIPAFELGKKIQVDNIRFTPIFTSNGKGVYSGIKKEISRQLNVVINKKQPLVQVNLPRFEFMDTPNHTRLCWFSFFSVNLGVDSQLYPCCLKKYVKGMGTSLHPDSFDNDIEKYFQKMLKFDAKSCNDCMYHKFNNYAEQASNPGRLDCFVP